MNKGVVGRGRTKTAKGWGGGFENKGGGTKGRRCEKLIHKLGWQNHRATAASEMDQKGREVKLISRCLVGC